jgi:hypothetical protein
LSTSNRNGGEKMSSSQSKTIFDHITMYRSKIAEMQR